MILIERKVVKGKTANIYNMNGFRNGRGETVRIYPGMNSIDPDIEGVIGSKNGKAIRGKITESPAWKKMIECGMHVIKSEDGAKDGSDSQDTTEMKAGDAVKVIETINNVDQLKVILTKEQGLNKQRQTVLDAIDKKMASVKDDFSNGRS